MNVKAVVNAVIPPAMLPAMLRISRTDWSEVEEAMVAGTPHYVRHGGTAKLLGAQPNDGFYSPQAGDVYLVVRLKQGTAPRGAEVEVRVEDMEVLKVEVS